MAIFPLSPDIETSYPSHSFGSPSKPIWVSFQSLLYLGTHRFWGKLLVVTLSLYFYETRQEKKSKPISHYLIPYKKGLPFDIIKLVEEMEKKVKHLVQGVSHTASADLCWLEWNLWNWLPSLPKFPLWRDPFGVQLYPNQKDIRFFLLRTAS